MSSEALPLSPEAATRFRHLCGFSTDNCCGRDQTACRLARRCSASHFVVGCRIALRTAKHRYGAETLLTVFPDKLRPTRSLSASDSSSFRKFGLASS